MGGTRALAAAADPDNDVACVIEITGFDSGTIRKAADRFGDTLHLVDVDDNSFTKHKTPKGAELYEEKRLRKYHSGKKFHHDNIDTIAQRAVLVVNTDQVDDEDLDMLYEAYSFIRSSWSNK